MSDQTVPGNEDAVAVQGSGGTGRELEADPIADPGLPPHLPRPTDVDPAAEKRAERQITAMFLLSGVFSVLFCIAYFAFEIGPEPDLILDYGASNVTLGLTLGMALLLIGIGAIQWARKLMSDVEIVEMRHPARSSDEDRATALAALDAGIEDANVKRRTVMLGALGGAMLVLAAPALILLRDLGPLPGNALATTVWRRGMRVVRDVSGEPIAAATMQIGELINAEPAVIFERNEEGEPEFEGAELLVAKSKAAVIVVRIEPEDLAPQTGRENWDYEGILCYSKICTHVGCPISLYEQQTHHVLCPCHQSTFDLAQSAKVVFGPAARALPQLPLGVDDEGFLIALDGFDEPVGPSYWERG